MYAVDGVGAALFRQAQQGSAFMTSNAVAKTRVGWDAFVDSLAQGQLTAPQFAAFKFMLKSMFVFANEE